MDKHEKIGIVMNVKNIGNGYSLYTPSHIVYGDIVDYGCECFQDKCDEQYILMSNPDSVYAEDQVVGYVLTKNELINNYTIENEEPGNSNSFDDIVIRYYSDIKSTIHVGFYHYKTGNLIFLDFNFENLLEYFNSHEDGTIEMTSEDLFSLLLDNDIEVEEEIIEEIPVVIEVEEVEKALNLLKNTLEESDLIKNKLTTKIEKNKTNKTKTKEIEELKNIIVDIEKLQKSFVKTKDIYNNLLDTKDYSEEKLKQETIENKKTNKSKVKKEKIDEETQENKIPFDVKEMKKFFDKKIIGQEQAKQDIISSLFMNQISDETISKNTCLLVGPTGSGKTLIAETVAEFLKLPFVSIDTTQLTMPGYVGANIEDFLERLIISADGDIEKAEKGVVVLDEIDKKGSSSNSDVAGKGVLNTLLPFIQGTNYDVSYNHKKIQFDTSKLTIFITGAFTDVAKGAKEEDYKQSNIGFGTSNKTNTKEDIKYKKLNIEDFVNYGNIPIEFIGRISTITQLSGHTKESLKTILTDSNISVLKLEKNKLEKVGIKLKYNGEYLDEIATEALKLGTGARSLKSIIDKSIKTARWEAIYNKEKYQEIILNKESVKDSDEAVLVYKDGNYNTVKEIKQKNNELTKPKQLKKQK